MHQKLIVMISTNAYIMILCGHFFLHDFSNVSVRYLKGNSTPLSPIVIFYFMKYKTMCLIEGGLKWKFVLINI